jgi:hypothetical protein
MGWLQDNPQPDFSASSGFPRLEALESLTEFIINIFVKMLIIPTTWFSLVCSINRSGITPAL